MGSLLRIDTRGSRGNSDIEVELERGANYNLGRDHGPGRGAGDHGPTCR